VTADSRFCAVYVPYIVPHVLKSNVCIMITALKFMLARSVSTSNKKKTTQLKHLLSSPQLAFLMEAHSGLSARIVQEAGTYLNIQQTAELTYHDNITCNMRQWNALHCIKVWFKASEVIQIQWRLTYNIHCLTQQFVKQSLQSKQEYLNHRLCLSVWLLLLTKLLQRFL